MKGDQKTLNMVLTIKKQMFLLATNLDVRIVWDSACPSCSLFGLGVIENIFRKLFSIILFFSWLNKEVIGILGCILYIYMPGNIKLQNYLDTNKCIVS